MFRYICLWFGLSLTTVSFALEEESERTGERTPEEWLFAMNKAIHVQPYSGDLFYQNGRNYMTLNLKFDYNAEGKIKTIIRRTDSPFMQVERRNARFSYMQDDRSPVSDGLTSGITTIPGLQDWLKNTRAHYKVGKVGEATVAGRHSVVIEIDPNTHDRNQMRMWLDRETAIPLRVQIIEPEPPHQVLESMSFTNVQLGSVDPELEALYDERYPSGNPPLDFAVTVESVDMLEIKPAKANRRAKTVPRDPCLRTQNNCWLLEYAPEGFELTSTTGTQTHTGFAALMMFHSDGLTTFSVFIQPYFLDPQDVNVVEQGSTLAVSRTIDTKHGFRYLVTTVGDIPEQTAIKITEGVRYLD